MIDFNSEEVALDNFDLHRELTRILGHASVQVQTSINQCSITQKEQLGQILVQMYVQVWNKSKSKQSIAKLTDSTIKLLILLENQKLSASTLNTVLEFGPLYELKRKIITPLTNFGYIAMTYPDKPTSAKQTYTLTEKGRALFNQ